MTDESPLVRQWILLRTLCARRYGATVKEMAEEMQVSEKTIRRDPPRPGYVPAVRVSAGRAR